MKFCRTFWNFELRYGAEIIWNLLPHLPLDKMAAILQTLFSDAYSRMKNCVFWMAYIPLGKNVRIIEKSVIKIKCYYIWYLLQMYLVTKFVSPLPQWHFFFLWSKHFYPGVHMPLCGAIVPKQHILLLWKLDWAYQFLQAKNWKTTNFGSKKVIKFGSYKIATKFGFVPDCSRIHPNFVCKVHDFCF